MNTWWISWYSAAPLHEFELHSPWWISGYSDDATILVAAVRAPDEISAWMQIRGAYDNGPEPNFAERFIEPLYGPPFADRWPQANWMAWDDQGTCACRKCRPLEIGHETTEKS